MEKRKVAVSIGGQYCSFYTDDPDEYIAELERRSNAVMRETARFSGPSTSANAVLSVLYLTDELMRREQKGTKKPAPVPGEAEKGTKKPAPVSGEMEKGQISVWDLLED